MITTFGDIYEKNQWFFCVLVIVWLWKAFKCLHVKEWQFQS